MSVESLQQRIGVKPDGDFGPKTIKAAAKYFQLSNEEAAHFFGQCSHETGEFRVFEENLNYRSADSLVRVFNKDFDMNGDRKINPLELEKAKSLVGKPIAIANFVYANQNGNGNEASGDGWKYRGRFAIQTTGRSNYTALSIHLKDPLVLSDPDSVKDKYTFEAAKFFFDKNHLWPLCKAVNDASIIAVTKRVNGGVNGLAHRRELTLKYYAWLKA